MAASAPTAGALDCGDTSPLSPPAASRRERIEIFGEGGGDVFTSIHNLVANLPLPNLLALFETVRSYR